LRCNACALYTGLDRLLLIDIQPAAMRRWAQGLETDWIDKVDNLAARCLALQIPKLLKTCASERVLRCKHITIIASRWQIVKPAN